jgi:3-methyladenine DNA glycosylase/8-oxoguanine DNA glycosylase
VMEFGEPAPGPLALHVPPAPSTLAEIPYWSLHRIGLERRRAEVIRNACRRATRLESTCELEPEAAYRVLRSLPGVGVWTAAEVGARAYGDADAVSVGDFHLPHLVSWVLAGEPRGSDERMLELLAPFEGQRGRVIRMIEARAGRRPRVAPRPSARSIAGL